MEPNNYKIFVSGSFRDDIIDSVKSVLPNTDVVFGDVLPDDEYDITVIINNDGYDFEITDDYIANHKVIRVHPSLLPAFNTSTPIKDAFISGVKVTGVTVHRVENNDMSGLILSQYPVMIDSYTGYQQLADEIIKLEAQLLPYVLKSVLEDKIFDIVDFLNGNKTHNCGGCGGCHKCGE